MKKKILISLVACFIAAGSIIHFNLAENISRMNVSLADISVMAQADGEDITIICDYPSPGRCWDEDCILEWGPFPMFVTVCTDFTNLQYDICVPNLPC